MSATLYTVALNVWIKMYICAGLLQEHPSVQWLYQREKLSAVRERDQSGEYYITLLLNSQVRLYE